MYNFEIFKKTGQFSMLNYGKSFATVMFCVLSPVQLPNNSRVGPGTSMGNLASETGYKHPKIVLKSVIYHLYPGPDGKLFDKMTKYFYLKK